MCFGFSAVGSGVAGQKNFANVTLIFLSNSVLASDFFILEIFRMGKAKEIKSAQFYEPIAEQAINFRVLGIDLKPALKHFLPPQEDYVLRSRRLPIFVAADGVTLEPEIAGYPKPSGAAWAARLFCEAFIKTAENSYAKMDEAGPKLVFRAANLAVKKYNDSRGRARGRLNYWDRDLFATTAAAAIIKDGKIYWLSISDAFLAVYDKRGRKKFQTPDRWPSGGKFLPRDWNSKPFVERKKILRKIYRNGIDKKGRLIGYGVATGEAAAERYLNFGSLPVKAGDFALLGTDGFTPYLSDRKFLKLFLKSQKGLNSKLRKFTAKKCEQNPSSFGHERSLIAVWI